MVSKLPINKHVGALNFKRLSQDSGRTKLAENLRASPFDQKLSNETTSILVFFIVETKLTDLDFARQKKRGQEPVLM
jgi:hypothetical protein